jgi:hypothetical protein
VAKGAEAYVGVVQNELKGYGEMVEVRRSAVS